VIIKIALIRINLRDCILIFFPPFPFYVLSAVNLKRDQSWSTSGRRRFLLIRIDFIEFQARIKRPLHLIRLVSRDMVNGVAEI